MVVHVEEAVRLGTMSDDPHLRLGLILLDSAAELLLHRECHSRLHWAEQDERQSVRLAEEMHQATGKEPEWLAELREKAVPAARCRQIDRDFGAKCDYLLGLGVLAEPHARVLKKLHKYRNEAYHRDRFRLGTLASATKIYIYLVCSLMRDFPMTGTDGCIRVSPRPPAGLVRYLDDDESWQHLVVETGVWGLQRHIASRLLAEAGIALSSGMGEVLAQHFCDRLDALKETAEGAVALFYSQGRDEGWDWEAGLSLAQLDPRNLLRVMSSDEVKSAAVPVHPAQISQWRAEGEALASQTDDLAAFATFADLEDTFEPLEALVIQLQVDVDGDEVPLPYDPALMEIGIWPS